jgi:hypothetical protein
MKWYRYRSMSSSGYSLWTYIDVPSYIDSDDNELRMFFEEQGNVPTWSEHYRGVEWVLPANVLAEKVASAKSQLKFWRDKVKKLSVLEPSKTEDINIKERRRSKKKHIRHMNNHYRKIGRLDLIKKYDGS